jgi:hypothetical protein
MDGDDSCPVAYIRLLLLPCKVATELEAWVVEQQLAVRQVTPLLCDLAYMLDVKDAVELGLGSSPRVTSTGTSNGSDLAGGIHTTQDVAGLADQAGLVAEGLVGVFQQWGLHAAEDFVLVLKQQLLVAVRRLQPLAAGALPSREEAAAAAGCAVDAPTVATGGANGSGSDLVMGLADNAECSNLAYCSPLPKRKVFSIKLRTPSDTGEWKPHTMTGENAGHLGMSA